MDREELLHFFEEQAKPLSVAEIETMLEIHTASEFKSLLKLLNKMEEEGELVRTRTNRYGLPERMGLVKGHLQGHGRGFAFLIPEQPGEPDVYISTKDLNGAMHLDTVLVRINHKRSGPALEGEVVRILKRGLKEVVGLYQDRGSYGLVVPDDKHIAYNFFIPKDRSKGAAEGHKVVVRITKYPEGSLDPEGEVAEVLGHKNDPGVDILSIVRKYQLPESFPAEVLEEVEKIPDEISPEELKGRQDLRSETIVTIDGEDAKDLDDAISVKRLPNGHYLLGVHIADVSYYVKEGSHLDKEAMKRGTSVYLVDRVLPMLPHRLSNGICSLNPQQDRLTLTCEMEITPEGEVIRHQFFPSVIRSTERMTYAQVRQIIEREDEALVERYRDLVPLFDLMKELALILRAKRMRRGAIDFDFKEAKIKVDEQGKPVDILLMERSIAENIIEEFMLAANETVAEHFYWLQVPFIYRIHEDPKPEKMQAFLEFVTNFGYVVRGTANRVHPRSMQQLLEEIKDTPEEIVISTVMLRSLQQARYAPECVSHYGLAVNYYTHFTAPIRRYPDLVVHRLLRTYLFEKRMDEKIQAKWAEKLPHIAEHSSIRERLAEEAARETDDLKKAEYMQERIGEEFEGVISGVTSFGLFVKLPNTVEGLVHVSYLTDDYYHFHDKQYALIGERSGRIFRIGDHVKVRVIGVNLDERSVDFELVEAQPRRSRSKKKGKNKNILWQQAVMKAKKTRKRKI